MKTAALALSLIGSLALTANDANAKHTQYQPTAQSSASSYWSLSQGRQSYPNPDRELYVNRSCCS
jgi:hypothetical protein